METKAQTASEPKIEVPEIKIPEMPNLDEGPKSFFDEKTGSFWVGLPVSKIDYMTCSAILDRCKLDTLVIYQAAAVRAQQNKLVTPDKGGVRNFITRVMSGKKG